MLTDSADGPSGPDRGDNRVDAPGALSPDFRSGRLPMGQQRSLVAVLVQPDVTVLVTQFGRERDPRLPHVPPGTRGENQLNVRSSLTYPLALPLGDRVVQDDDRLETEQLPKPGERHPEVP